MTTLFDDHQHMQNMYRSNTEKYPQIRHKILLKKVKYKHFLDKLSLNLNKINCILSGDLTIQQHKKIKFETAVIVFRVRKSLLQGSNQKMFSDRDELKMQRKCQTTV